MESCLTGALSRPQLQTVDDATDAYPAYYMINCAHPTHFAPILEPSCPMDRPHQSSQGEQLPQEPRRTGRGHRTRPG